MFRVHLKEKPPTGYREAFLGPDESKMLAILENHLFDAGLMMINTCSAAISTPMTEAEIDTLVAAFGIGFRKLQTV